MYAAGGQVAGLQNACTELASHRRREYTFITFLMNNAEHGNPVTSPGARLGKPTARQAQGGAGVTGKTGKVKALQRILTHSFHAKVLAVKRVTSTNQVIRLSNIGIRRYIKVRAQANPYLKEFGGYFYQRRNDKNAKIRTHGQMSSAGSPHKVDL